MKWELITEIDFYHSLDFSIFSKKNFLSNRQAESANMLQLAGHLVSILDVPRNLHLVSQQQPEKVKRDNSKNNSAISVHKDVKFMGPMFTCKSSTFFNRNFNISIWKSCEILGTPPSRNLKTQTLAVVLSCWNYLFSNQGQGTLKALTMETLENTLLKRDTYDFTVNNSTVNDIVVQWIANLNSTMDTRSKTFMFYKPVGKNNTNVSSEEALTILQNELNHKNTFLIYHAHDAILIPVGYQISTGKKSSVLSTSVLNP